MWIRPLLQAALFYYIEAFRNRLRLHAALDYFSPGAYELLYHPDAGAS